MRRILVVAMIVCATVVAAASASASRLAAVTPVAQERRAVDVDEVWPFWVALSGLVFVIGALSMWDTRRRRRRGRGTRAN